MHYYEELVSLHALYLKSTYLNSQCYQLVGF